MRTILTLSLFFLLFGNARAAEPVVRWQRQPEIVLSGGHGQTRPGVWVYVLPSDATVKRVYIEATFEFVQEGRLVQMQTAKVVPTDASGTSAWATSFFNVYPTDRLVKIHVGEIRETAVVNVDEKP